MAVVSEVQAVTLRGTGTNEKEQLNQVIGRMSEGMGMFSLDKEDSEIPGNQIPKDLEDCRINLGAASQGKPTSLLEGFLRLAGESLQVEL